MTGVVPGDENYEEILQRVAGIIRDTESGLSEIHGLSEDSFREWLMKVFERVATTLGVALGKAQALVADVLTALSNAGTTFMGNYRRSYESARRIQRRR
jgi:hypothetical protein